MQTPAEPTTTVVDKPMMGTPAGARLLIATPMIVQDYMRGIPSGETRTMAQMRAELAQRFQADATCPLTSGIFARIVAEAALDERTAGKPENQITPFWRLVDPKSQLAKKLSCGIEYVEARRSAEQSQEK